MTTQISTTKKIDVLSQIIKNEPELISFLKEGDFIEAELLGKIPKAAYFNLDKFGTGIVYGAELWAAKEIIKNLVNGEKISAKISALENENGFIELSISDAHKQKGWQELKNLMEKEEIIGAKIIGANSGGLVSEINGIKAFLPLSQLSSKNYPRLENKNAEEGKNEIIKELRKLVNQELKIKIIDINPRINKLIISERASETEDIKKMLENYKIGDVIDGIVTAATNFGVFVKFADNPLIEGFIHISELDYKIIDNPKDIVKINEQIKVKILEIKNSSVNLSLKALKADPWEKIEEKLKIGQEISGAVYKFNPFGALINFGENFQGIIRVSEFGGIEEMKKTLSEENKTYKFIIDSISAQDKRIILKFIK
ncbi:30S ribosomal protein S1 [Candidatus Wolfebacteria bacterium]|nr:30S ribosomal protein S1 [Candidatus Wolfebacteria bacterium]